ncbi:hypothetical protein FOZ61_004871 [Perkinsus olseni]|uniref:Uncharacterized protein n=1 Tax=Perkinsus olseni TaxID=32597 RepID=A0A7J6LJI9_PEROL|nr:hypothetical protein FOZ61_004871 [Perkinsus olseni]KAF4663904.1 hypothetical protein FOL46_004498 [Perkinsus olseni]
MSSPGPIKKPLRTQDIYQAVQRLKKERNEKQERLVKLRTRLHATEREASKKERTIRELNRLRQSKHPISKVLLNGMREDASTQLTMFRNKCAELEEEIVTVDDEIDRAKRTRKFTHLVELQAELNVWKSEARRLKEAKETGLQQNALWQQRSRDLNKLITDDLIPMVHELEGSSDLPDVDGVAGLAEEARSELETAFERKTEVDGSLELALAELSRRQGYRTALEELRCESAELEARTSSIARVIQRIKSNNRDFALSGHVYELALTDEDCDEDFIAIRQRLIDRVEEGEEWYGLLRLLGKLAEKSGGALGAEELVATLEANAIPLDGLNTACGPLRVTDLVGRIDLAASGRTPVEPRWQRSVVRWRSRGMEKETVRQALLIARSSDELLGAIGESEVVAFWEKVGAGRAIRAFDLNTTSWHQIGERRIFHLLKKCRGVTRQQWKAELMCPLDAVTYEDFIACKLFSTMGLEDIFIMLLAVSGADHDDEVVNLNNLYDLPVETFVAALRGREKPKDSIGEEGRQAADDAVETEEDDPALTSESDGDDTDLAVLFSGGQGDDGVKEEEVVQPLSALPDLASLFALDASEAPEAVATDANADHELDTL